MPEYIRRLVDRDLEVEAPRAEADPSAIIGLFDSGGSDIATQRTEAIGAAILEWAARKQI